MGAYYDCSNRLHGNRQAQLSRKLFLLPVFASVLISLSVVDLYLLGIVFKLDFIFDARYFIPITGMLIGNTLADMVVSLNNFYKGISKQQTTYRLLWLMELPLGSRMKLLSNMDIAEKRNLKMDDFLPRY